MNITTAQIARLATAIQRLIDEHAEIPFIFSDEHGHGYIAVDAYSMYNNQAGTAIRSTRLLTVATAETGEGFTTTPIAGGGMHIAFAEERLADRAQQVYDALLADYAAAHPGFKQLVGPAHSVMPSFLADVPESARPADDQVWFYLKRACKTGKIELTYMTDGSVSAKLTEDQPSELRSIRHMTIGEVVELLLGA